MRSILLLVAILVLLAPARAEAPAELWLFQGIGDIHAMDRLPDVDGDGVADILVESYDAGAVGDHLYLLSGGATGTPAVIWSARPQSGVSDGGGSGDDCLTASSDLNGDAFPDVLLGTAWGNRSVHALDGRDGDLLWTFDSYDEPASGWVYAVRPHPDRTGDGIPEVVFGTGSDGHRGYLLDGASGAVIWRFTGSTDAIGHTLSLPDVNGDGFADVLFNGWDNEHRVFCVTGAGSGFVTHLWARDTGASNHGATLIDDISGDGVAEIVVGLWRASNQVVCLDGATGVQRWSYHVGPSDYVMRLVTLDDIDGDGYRDLAIGAWTRVLPVISGATGQFIWSSSAGTLNGGDFWAVDRVDDVDGDGLGEVVGGSFDQNVYLFSGADGDTLWIFPTANRLFSVRGAPDLSGNGVADVLGGTQFLSSGGRVHALEGGDISTPVPDLPAAAGSARREAAGRVDIAWHCDLPVPCVVDRLEADADKAAAHRDVLAAAFAHGELTTDEVIAAVKADKSGGSQRLTPTALVPAGQDDAGWAYRLTDPAAPAAAVVYRVSAALADGREVVLLEMAPVAGGVPRAVLGRAAVAPTPFNPRTEVRFTLFEPAVVSLAVCDAAGRMVASVAPRSLPAGEGALAWDGRGHDGRDLPSGVYLLRLTADGESRALKGVLVR